MAFSLVTLTGSYTDGQGSQMSGELTFTLAGVMSNDRITAQPVSYIVALVGGAFSVALYANTDAGTIPTGMLWQVTEALYGTQTGAQAQANARDYNIEVPGKVIETNGTTSALLGAQAIQLSTLQWAQVVPGQSVTGSGVQAGTFVTGVDAGLNQVTISNNLLSYGTGLSFTFGATIDISALMPGTPQGFTPTGSNPAGDEAFGTYLDTVEVQNYLQFSSGVQVGGEQSVLLQRFIDAACMRAQTIANRPFGSTTFYERHDGWSGEYIQLHYSPFVQLVYCREWQSSGGMIDLTESTPENPIEGIQINYHSSRIMRTFAGYSWPRPFFPGSRNIEVAYKAGINPVPADVWQATCDLVAYWWRNTQQSSAAFVPGQEGYGGEQSQSDGLWPGIPNRIFDVFNSYRLPSIG